MAHMKKEACDEFDTLQQDLPNAPSLEAQIHELYSPILNSELGVNSIAALLDVSMC